MHSITLASTNSGPSAIEQRCSGELHGPCSLLDSILDRIPLQQYGRQILPFRHVRLIHSYTFILLNNLPILANVVHSFLAHGHIQMIPSNIP
jgi:hypothetical protein